MTVAGSVFVNVSAQVWSTPCPGAAAGARPRARLSAHMSATVALLPGDGIGPEVVASAVEVLRAMDGFEFTEHLVGGAAIDATGSPLPDETIAACREADAVLRAKGTVK